MLCKIIAMLIVPEVIELIELLKSKDKVVGSKQTKKALEQSRTTADLFQMLTRRLFTRLNSYVTKMGFLFIM